VLVEGISDQFALEAMSAGRMAQHRLLAPQDATTLTIRDKASYDRPGYGTTKSQENYCAQRRPDVTR